jgi:tRNA uridine 5-carboxymethylaminomethyl modification enzyme
VIETDKLLKLSVDLGEENPRQIISGIALYFPEPNSLVNKKCLFVANLEPRTIRGLENVVLKRAGYAVEYDSIDPTELKPSFMSKFCDGLFLAGQVNRTSGYEEAAAQGLWAGINAAMFLKEKEMLKPQRSRSYMETLVDDLVNRGTEEPYRLFTSRSEYRMLLREDNAHERMFDLADKHSLLSEEQKISFFKTRDECKTVREKLMSERIRLSADKVISLYEYLKRPEICWEDLSLIYEGGETALEKIEVEAKYTGYLGRVEAELRELERVRMWQLDPSVDISLIPCISKEVAEKYRNAKPSSVEELCLISGITPTAVLGIVKAAGRVGSVSHETRL